MVHYLVLYFIDSFFGPLIKNNISTVCGNVLKINGMLTYL